MLFQFGLQYIKIKDNRIKQFICIKKFFFNSWQKSLGVKISILRWKESFIPWMQKHLFTHSISSLVNDRLIQVKLIKLPGSADFQSTAQVDCWVG